MLGGTTVTLAHYRDEYVSKRGRLMSVATAERGRGRPRSEASHEAILAAVVPMIQARGYDAFSIEALAAQAGVGKATIYRRWASKEDLVLEALGRFVAAIPAPDTGGLRGDLLAVLDSDAKLHADPATPLLLASLVAAMARSPKIAEAVRGGFVASRRDALRAVLRRAVARGEARADLDVELAVELCAGPFLYRTLISGRAIDEAAVARLVDLLIPAFTEELRP
jgi:AcrR family transcriptional regulator